MNKFGVVSSVFVLGLGVISLAGCDLIGLGPKKQEPAHAQAPITVVAPVAASTQETQGPLPADALVRIGNWTLTTEEFNDRLNLLKQQLPNFKPNDPSSRGAVLDELVRQQLLVKEAEDSGAGDTKEIKDAVDDFRKTLLVQQMATRLTKDVIATEDDARAYYNANKDKFIEPIVWAVREIVVDDQATAKNILVQVLQGSDFAQMPQARKLKPFATGRAPFEAMQTAIDNLDTGGVSGVFKGPDGYYIVKVDSKKGGEPKSFDDVKKDLVYGLTMQKQQAAILTHLRDLAEKIKPEYNKDLIEKTVRKPAS